MLEKRRVKVSIREITRDIRSGLTDLELMKKYDLHSTKALQDIFRKLLDATAIDKTEIEERLVDQGTAAGTSGPRKDLKPRKVPRRKPFGKLTIHDVHDLAEEYTVADLSEAGIKISGIECSVGQRKEFLVRCERIDEVKPFSFSADCKWVVKGVGGFELTDIDPRALMEFRKLMSLFTFEE
jgi:hypothetical protein